MEEEKKKRSIFTPYSQSDPSMGVPVTSGGAITSPYLNFDPAYISPGTSEYIFPEGASRQRGRFELAFSQIGTSVFAGAALGGLNGLFSGYKETKEAQLLGAVRRTQMLNYVTKQGASSAQSLGVVAMMYSIFGVVLSWGRGVDDELNTMTAATATGLLYKSSAGMRKCLRGGGVGFGLALTYCLFTSRDRIRNMVSRG